MQTLKQWAVAVVAAIALGGFLGGFGSPAAADEPGPNHQAAPQYDPAPVRPVYPHAPPPVIYGYAPPPPAIVYYDYPPPVVIYPPRYRYAYGGYHPHHHGYRHHGYRHYGHRHHGHRHHGRHWHR